MILIVLGILIFDIEVFGSGGVVIMVVDVIEWVKFVFWGDIIVLIIMDLVFEIVDLIIKLLFDDEVLLSVCEVELFNFSCDE